MEQKSTLKSIWQFFVPVLILVPIILIGVGVSFVWGGEFTFRAYSDRLFWAGIGAAVLGAFGVFSSVGAAQMYGIPSIFTAGADSRNVLDRMVDLRATIMRRYGFTFRMAMVALICLITSAVIEILSR